MDTWSPYTTNQGHPVTPTHAQRYSIIIRSFLSGIGSDVLREILEEAADNAGSTLSKFLFDRQTKIIYSLQPKLKHQVVLVYPPDESEPNLEQWDCRLLCTVLCAIHCLDSRGLDDVGYILKTYQKHAQVDRSNQRRTVLGPKPQPKPRTEWIRTCAAVQRLVDNCQDTRLLTSVRNFICKIEMGSKTMDARIETHISLTKMISELAESHADRINAEESALRKQLGELAKMKQQFDAVSKPSFTTSRSSKNLSRSMIVNGKETRPLSARDKDVEDRSRRPKSAVSGISQASTASRMSGVKPFKRGYSFDSIQTNGTTRGRQRRRFSNTSQDRQPLRSVHLVTPKPSQTKTSTVKEEVMGDSDDDGAEETDQPKPEKMTEIDNDESGDTAQMFTTTRNPATLQNKNAGMTKSTKPNHNVGSKTVITAVLPQPDRYHHDNTIVRPRSVDVKRPHSLDSRRPHSFDVFHRNMSASRYNADRVTNRSISNFSYEDRQPKPTVKDRSEDIAMIYTQNLQLHVEQPKPKEHNIHNDKPQPSPRTPRGIPQQSLTEKQNDALMIVSQPAFSSLVAYTTKYRSPTKKKEPKVEPPPQPTIEEPMAEEVEEPVEEPIDDPESDKSSVEEDKTETEVVPKSRFGRFKAMLKSKLTSKKQETDDKQQTAGNRSDKENIQDNLMGGNMISETDQTNISNGALSERPEDENAKKDQSKTEEIPSTGTIGQLRGMLLSILPTKEQTLAHKTQYGEEPEVTEADGIQAPQDNVVVESKSPTLQTDQNTASVDRTGTLESKKGSRVHFFTENDNGKAKPNPQSKFNNDRKRRQSMPAVTLRSLPPVGSTQQLQVNSDTSNSVNSLMESPTNDRISVMKQRRSSVATSALHHGYPRNNDVNGKLNNSLKLQCDPIKETENTVTVEVEKEENIHVANAENSKSTNETLEREDKEKSTKTDHNNLKTSTEALPTASNIMGKVPKDNGAPVFDRRKSIAISSLRLPRDKVKHSQFTRTKSESEFNPEALKKAFMKTDKHAEQLKDPGTKTDPGKPGEKPLLNKAVLFEDEDSDTKTKPKVKSVNNKVNDKTTYSHDSQNKRQKSVMLSSETKNVDFGTISPEAEIAIVMERESSEAKGNTTENKDKPVGTKENIKLKTTSPFTRRKSSAVDPENETNDTKKIPEERDEPHDINTENEKLKATAVTSETVKNDAKQNNDRKDDKSNNTKEIEKQETTSANTSTRQKYVVVVSKKESNGVKENEKETTESEKPATSVAYAGRKSVAFDSLRSKPKENTRSSSADGLNVHTEGDIISEQFLNETNSENNAEQKNKDTNKTSEHKTRGSSTSNKQSGESSAPNKAKDNESIDTQIKTHSKENIIKGTHEKQQKHAEQKQTAVEENSSMPGNDGNKKTSRNGSSKVQTTNTTKTQQSVSTKKGKSPISERRKSVAVDSLRQNRDKNKHKELVRSKSDEILNDTAFIEGNKKMTDKTSTKKNKKANKSVVFGGTVILEEEENEEKGDTKTNTIQKDDNSETKNLQKDDNSDRENNPEVNNARDSTPEDLMAPFNKESSNTPEPEDDPEAEMKRLANDVIVHYQVHKIAREIMEKDRKFVDEFFTFLHKYKATKEFLKVEQFSPFKTMKLPSGMKAALSFLHAFTFRHVNVFERDDCHYVVEKILKRTECEDAKLAKKEEDAIISRVKAEVKSRKKTPFHDSKSIAMDAMANLRKQRENEKSTKGGDKLDDPSNKRPVSALRKLHSVEICRCWKCRHKELAMTIAVNWRNHGICNLLLSYGVHFKIEHLLPAVRANDGDNVKEIVTYLKERFEWEPDNDDAKMALILARFHDMPDIVTFLEKQGVQDERVVQCTCFA